MMAMSKFLIPCGTFASIVIFSELWISLEFGIFFLTFFVSLLIILEESPTTWLKESWEVFSNLLQNCVPVNRHNTLRENNSFLIQVFFDEFNALSWNRIDSLESVIVPENDGHVEVLDTMWDSLEMYSLDVFDILNKEGVLADGDQATWSWSDFNDRFHRATLERHILRWNFKGKRGRSFLRLVLDQLWEVIEFSRQLLLGFPLTFF